MTEKVQKVFQKRKKLNLRIKQKLQVWLLIRIMGVALLTITVAGVILYFYSVTVVDTDYLSFAPKVRKVSEVLLPVFLAASLTSIVAGLLLALFLSQKIAGPVFRIEQDLLRMRTGDLTEVVSIRSSDILKELAQSVNMTVHNIRNMLNDVKEINSDLESKITKGDITGIRAAYKKQKECLDKLII
jgi:methyl-accepting chemotaxis protein